MKLSVRQFVDITNSLLSSNLESVVVEGEVAGFKINQNKYVFFDLKDTRDGTTVNIFMMLSRLTVPLEDGMKILVRGKPKLTDWGRFSLTVDAVQPVGDGNIRKAFEVLKARLATEGLFDEERKKTLSDVRAIRRIGVVSSTAAAGFIDFVKIMNARSGGHALIVANTVVQGVEAPGKLIRALERLDAMGDLDVIVILRGGGSADDLAAFNDEALVRAIAAARTPIVTGIGHEIDTTLADLAADLRASTPSNAAELLTFDVKYDIIRSWDMLGQIKDAFIGAVSGLSSGASDLRRQIGQALNGRLESFRHQLDGLGQFFAAVNPETVLAKGYALVRGSLAVGNQVEIETMEKIIKAEVKDVKKRK